jgi:hypothetical protein
MITIDLVKYIIKFQLLILEVKNIICNFEKGNFITELLISSLSYIN